MQSPGKLLKIGATFKVYDAALWLGSLCLLYYLCDAYATDGNPAALITSSLALCLFWGYLLVWHIRRIEFVDTATILFKSFFRTIPVNPADISAVEDWLLGLKITVIGKPVYLWPFLENPKEFKAVIHKIDPAIRLSEDQKNPCRRTRNTALLLVALFICFAWLTWQLFDFSGR